MRKTKFRVTEKLANGMRVTSTYNSAEEYYLLKFMHNIFVRWPMKFVIWCLKAPFKVLLLPFKLIFGKRK